MPLYPVMERKTRGARSRAVVVDNEGETKESVRLCLCALAVLMILVLYFGTVALLCFSVTQ